MVGSSGGGGNAGAILEPRMDVFESKKGTLRAHGGGRRQRHPARGVYHVAGPQQFTKDSLIRTQIFMYTYKPLNFANRSLIQIVINSRDLNIFKYIPIFIK